MQSPDQATAKRTLSGAIIGTLLVAVCCFTPLLVIILGVIGLSAFMPYLDYVLLPLLALFVVVLVISYRKYRRSLKEAP